MSVTVEVADPNFHGVMYVKGHSNDPNCRRTVENGEAAEPLDFAVKFDTCGLFHSDVSNIILGFPILYNISVLFIQLLCRKYSKISDTYVNKSQAFFALMTSIQKLPFNNEMKKLMICLL